MDNQNPASPMDSISPPSPGGRDQNLSGAGKRSGEETVVELTNDEELTYKLVKNHKKPIRDRLNPFKISPISPSSTPLTDILEEMSEIFSISEYSISPLPPTPENTEPFESTVGVINTEELRVSTTPVPLAISVLPSKSTYCLEDFLDLPPPPEILDAVSARAMVEGVIKPSPIKPTPPEQLQKDLDEDQSKFYRVIDLQNDLLMNYIRTRQLNTTQKDVIPSSFAIVNQHLLAPPNTPDLVTIKENQLQTSKLRSTNPFLCDLDMLTDNIYNSEASSCETMSSALNALPDVEMNHADSAVKERKKYNYVMVSQAEEEPCDLNEKPKIVKTKTTVNKIPINESITAGKMTVSKYRLYECIDLLIGVLNVFDNQHQLSSQSQNSSAAPKVDIEQNIIACINTLISFSGDRYELTKVPNRANKGNIFVDAKEKYNSMVESKRKRYHKFLSKDVELKKPLPIPISDTIKIRGRYPSPQSTKKSISTQVNCSEDITKKTIPIPNIVIAKPKCPLPSSSPLPSPYPSPKFRGKFKGCSKYCQVDDTNSDEYASLVEIEKTTSDFQTAKPLDFANDDNVSENNETTYDTLATVSHENNEDSRYDQSNLSTFSPNASKQKPTILQVPEMEMVFLDNSNSPYEVPKCMMRLGSTKSLSTSNLKEVGKYVAMYGEIDKEVKSDSITTIADDIVYSNLIQTTIKDSPLLQNSPRADDKASPFRTLLKKVARPFKKSPNLEKQDISTQGNELKKSPSVKKKDVSVKYNKSKKSSSVEKNGVSIKDNESKKQPKTKNKDISLKDNGTMKSPNLEKKDVPVTEKEDKNEDCTSNQIDSSKAPETQPSNVVCNKDIISPSGTFLTKSQIQECKKRFPNFEAWLGAQNAYLLGKKGSQFIYTTNPPKADGNAVFQTIVAQV